MATRGGRLRWLGLALALTLALMACGALLPGAAGAVDGTVAGSASGLPIPRFVSLKSDRVNLREGPSKDHRTSWVFQRAGLPVEVTAEFETWRRIRDSEGAEGWVLHSLLSGRRTALVAPWSKQSALPLYSQPNSRADTVAELQPGVLGTLKACNGAWCRLVGSGFDGWIAQDKLWGAYPGEKVE